MEKGKLFIVVWFIALFTSVTAAGPLEFYQSDFVLDGTAYTNTDWGSVDLTYTGSASIMYLNVAVNGSWQIQNIPVLSQEGVGVTHTKNYSFDLGVTSGTSVTGLTYDYSLTTSTMLTMPTGSNSAVVGDRTFTMSSGVNGTTATLTSAAQLIGHMVIGAAHVNSGFPNQDCGVDECVPTAVSNSLQFLNAKKNLGIDAGKITIDKMKEAVNWGTKTVASTPGAKIDRILNPYLLKDDPHECTGAWITHDATAAEGEKNAWWQDKDAYMKANGLPITTKIITNLGDLAAELDDDQDVELQGDWHTAAIVGLTEFTNGCFAIDVAHDTKQGTLGGTMVQTIIYCPTTGKFIGSPGFFDGSVFRYAIVECPEPATVAMLSFGGLLFRRRK